MERIKRKPFQGVGNIVRFNWHFYVLVIILFCASMVLRQYVPPWVALVITAGVLLMLLITIVSLSVSFYIYDLSGLYNMQWLSGLNIGAGAALANINAGFDETSALLAARYPAAKLSVYDFYDPALHTEVSIKRARKAYPPYPGTQAINTTYTQLPLATYDHVFGILALHEIRQRQERVVFFKMLKNSLKPSGSIIVVEHLRNLPNFLAYSIGFLHFHSPTEWYGTFADAGLSIRQELKITPFIRVFILQ